MEKSLYYYKGAILEFGKIIEEHWEGETYAKSISKARSNLTYQFKKEHGKTPNTKISLASDPKKQ